MTFYGTKKELFRFGHCILTRVVPQTYKRGRWHQNHVLVTPSVSLSTEARVVWRLDAAVATVTRFLCRERVRRNGRSSLRSPMPEPRLEPHVHQLDARPGLARLKIIFTETDVKCYQIGILGAAFSPLLRQFEFITIFGKFSL